MKKILKKKSVINFIKNNLSPSIMLKSINPKYREENITVPYYNDVANIFLLGKINHHCSLKTFEKKTRYLNQILSQKDFGFIYSDYPLKEKLQTKLNQEHFEVITPGCFKIFEIKNIKVGVIALNAHEYSRLTRKINQIKTESNYIICYLKGNKKENKVITKKLIEKGIECIITNNFVIGKRVRKKSRSFIVKGMNNLSTHSINILKRDGFIIKLGLKMLNNRRIIEKSYIPYFIAPFYQGQTNVILPIPMTKNDPSMTAIIAARRRVGAVTSGLLESNRYFNFGRICELINIKVPSKYEHLKDEEVKNVCLYPFEIKDRYVLFLRTYDKTTHECSKKEYYEKKLLKLDAVRKRNKLIFVFSPIKLSAKIPHMVVPDPLVLHRQLCIYMRNLYDINFAVAVTGSVGKTTCKEMIASVLNEKYLTYQNKLNGNLQRQIGKTIAGIKSYYEVYAQEVGGGKINGASNSSMLISPNAAVVTNVGHSHLRWSGTREQLLKNKTGIKDGLVEDGILYYNLDNDMLSTYKPDCKCITFAINNHQADYYATNIKQEKNVMKFTLNHGKKKVAIKLNMIGEHNVYNALVAYAIGKQANLSNRKIKRGLLKYRTKGIRQNTISVAGMTLYVDCYNAAPESVSGAIKTISELPLKKGKRIAVLADITGMGNLTEKVHVELAESIAKNDIDILIGIGEFIKQTCDLLKNSQVQSFYFNDPLKAAKKIESIMESGDILLFKGSSLFSMEENVIDNVFGTSLVEIRDYDDTKYTTNTNNKYKYRVFSNHDSILKYNGKQKKVVIPSKIKSIVKRINDEAFANSEVQEVALNRSITNIGNNAFYNCKKLTKIKLSDQLKIIYDKAFKNCNALTNITIPNKTLHIGEYAFMGCTNLKEIIIPNSVRYIADNTFKGCPKLSITCNQNSYAYQYAKSKGIKTNILEPKNK